MRDSVFAMQSVYKLISHKYARTNVGPIVELAGLLERQVDAAVRPRFAKIFGPVGAVDCSTMLCKIQIPRHAGKIVLVVANARKWPLHITARCLFVDGKGATRRRREIVSRGDGGLHKHVF